MTRRTACASVVGTAAVLLIGLTGCGNDASNVTCQDFLNMTEEEQRVVAGQWVVGTVGEGEPNEGQLAMGSVARTELLNYCPSNPDDKIKDLMYGPG